MHVHKSTCTRARVYVCVCDSVCSVDIMYVFTEAVSGLHNMQFT